MTPWQLKKTLLLRGAAAGLLALVAVSVTAKDAAPAGEPGATKPGPPQQERSAQELIQRHCTRCHLAPDPRDLSREYWSYALHYMGNYVGMKGDEFPDMTVSPVPPDWEPQQDYTKRYILSDSQGYMRDLYPFKMYIPPAPEMSAEEFRRIRAY